MNDYLILAAMASDLKRVALGLERGSEAMAKRFSEEALARKREIKLKKSEPYLINLLNRIEQVLSSLSNTGTAEDALMYSTLLQNFIRQRQGSQNT